MGEFSETDGDDCGDSNDWVPDDLALERENYISVVPARCDGAN